MATVSNTITMQDRMTPVLETIIKSLQSTVDAMAGVDHAGNASFRRTQGDVQAASEALVQFNNNLDEIPPEIKRGAREAKKLGNKLGEAVRQSTMLEKVLAGLTIAGITRMVGSFFNSTKATADAYNLKNAQIAQMAGGLEDVDALQRRIMQSANSVNAEFTMMAGTIYKLNATVGEMLGSSENVIQFAENIKMGASISASGAHGIEMSFRVIDRAMAQGRMSAQDFDFFKQYNIRAVEAMADHLGVSVLEMRNLAVQGELTRDVIADALLGATSDLQDDFAQIPKTWQDIVTRMHNASLRAFSPLMRAWSDFINSDSFKRFKEMWITAIEAVAMALNWMFGVFTIVFDKIVDIAQSVGNFLAEHWNIVLGVVAAGVIALGYMFVKMGIKALIAWMTALWPVFLIIGAVALLIKTLEMFGIGVEKVLGFVAGLFGALFAFLWNMIAFTWNNILVPFVEFFANMFNDPVNKIMFLLWRLGGMFVNVFAWISDKAGEAGRWLANGIIDGINAAIRGINWLVRALNNLPFFDINEMSEFGNMEMPANTVGDGMRSGWEAMRPEVSEDRWEAPRMEYRGIMETASSWNQGVQGFVGGLGDRMAGLLGGGLDAGYDLGVNNNLLDSINQGVGDLGGAMGNGLGAGTNIGDIGQIRDDVTIADEDLKLLRDIAERDVVLNYQQITPNVSLTVHNNGGEYNEERLLDRIEDMVIDAIDSNLDN